MKRLICFVGAYDTLDIFTYELVNKFEELGYEVLIIDTKNMEKGLKELAQFIVKPVKAVFAFNNLGFNMELVEGKNIWEELQIPCVNILVDHPFCYRVALEKAPANAAVLCIDRNHMNYISRFYPQIAVTGFLPHAGKEYQVPKKMLNERSIEVFYAGGFSRAFASNIIPNLDKFSAFDAKKLCKDVYEKLISVPSKTTENAIEESLAEMGVCVAENELCEIISELHFVELYAVSFYREKVIWTLVNAGIEVTICGGGWQECEWISMPNVTYLGKIPPEDVLKKMQDSKIVLNTMTWFKDGAHERIFNGMLQNAVVVTDTSIYLKETFCGSIDADGKDKREMVMFELNNMESLPEQVGFLLDNLEVAQNIADRGYIIAKRGHTWQHRAEELEKDLISLL